MKVSLPCIFAALYSTLACRFAASQTTVTPPSLNFEDGMTGCEPGTVSDPLCITLGRSSTVDKIDIFFLFDDTGSFSSFVTRVNNVIASLVANLATALPSVDIAYGIGRFEDYLSAGPGNQGFILNQPIVTEADAVAANTTMMALLSAALSRSAPGNGNDFPETAIEGLYQVATGLGLDLDGDGGTTGVPAGTRLAGSLLTQTTDTGYNGEIPAFATLDPSVVSSGSVGGAGFRPDALKLVVLATDICSVAPFDSIPIPATITTPFSSEPNTAFNCFSRTGEVGTVSPDVMATVPATMDALVAAGIRVIGLETRSLPFLDAIARLTNAVDGDGNPLVFDIDADPSVLRDAVVNAVLDVSTLAVDIATSTDCEGDGLSVGLDSPIGSVEAGGTACFDTDFVSINALASRSCNVSFVDQDSGLILNSIPVTYRCDDTGGGGDPHFATWSGQKFSFHGECDLVLIQDPDFQNGKGLHVHGRTKIHHDWSAFESAAIKIGDDVFEMRGKNEYWLNGKPNVELPAMVGGLTIDYDGKQGAHITRIAIQTGDEKADKLIFKAYDEFLWILVEGHTQIFSGSTGLLGSYNAKAMLGRDSKSIITDPNNFGQEWQVQDTDVKLFHDAEGPQYPNKCILPVHPKINFEETMRLGGSSHAEAAKKACEHAKSMVDDCIADVLATKDLGIAKAY